jgi:hypothetical protein
MGFINGIFNHLGILGARQCVRPSSGLNTPVCILHETFRRIFTPFLHALFHYFSTHCLNLDHMLSYTCLLCLRNCEDLALTEGVERTAWKSLILRLTHWFNDSLIFSSKVWGTSRCRRNLKFGKKNIVKLKLREGWRNWDPAFSAHTKNWECRLGLNFLISPLL